MVLLAHLLSALFTLLMPFLVGVAIQRRLGAPWSLFGAGAVTFLASQVVHLPLIFGVAALFSRGILPTPPDAVAAVLLPLALGLSAGLCEELARWVALQWLDARTWSRGLMFGAGHGGIEALMVGVYALAAWFQLVAMHGVDLSTRYSAEMAALAKAQSDAYFDAPLALTVVVAAERVGAMCIHLGCASLVVRSVARRQPLWLLAAIALHSAVDSGVVVLPKYGLLVAEGWVGLCAVASMAIVVALREANPPVVSANPIVPLTPRRVPLASGESVDRSRYE